MKNNKSFLLLLTLGLLNINPINCQNMLNVTNKSTTFQVCDVKKAKSPICPFHDGYKTYQEVVIDKTINERNEKDRSAAILNDTSLAVKERWRLRNDTSYQPMNVPIRKLEALSAKDEQLIPTNFHPFMETMHRAYAEHYPMTISPDMIWLLITQGFAIHINQNPENLRHYFVDFKGKKNIDISGDGLIKGASNNNWPEIFDQFSKKIEANTGAELLELVTGEFSTTGPTEKAAFQVTLMDAMKSYFTYSVTTMCGIPEITLEGTPDDWKKIEIKAQELAQYDLEWWIDDLLPVLKEFTKAASGQPDVDFWNSIYKLNSEGSGSSYITGWILRFFPYKDLRGKFVRSKKKPIANSRSRISTPLNTTTKEGVPKITYHLTATTDELTSGLSKADFLWDYYGNSYKMEFVAGFVGFQQDPTTLSLRPEISWVIIDKQMKPTDEEIETYKKGGNEEYLKNKH